MRRAFSHTGQMSPENDACFTILILVVGFFVFFPWSLILLFALPGIFCGEKKKEE